jgi:hypothetical protein
MSTTLEKKRPGGGAGRPPRDSVGLFVRISATEAEKLDRWIAGQSRESTSRQEAARLLLTRSIAELD